MTGSLSVLNVGAGDIQIVFNQHDSAERDRAIRMLTDMQKRGYAILVRLEDGTYTRAIEIDAKGGCYVIADRDTAPGGSLQTGLDDGPKLPKRGRGRQRKRVSVTRTHATAIARSAGG